MTKQLPAGWSTDDVLALPEVQEAIEKAKHQAHEVCGLWLDSGKGYMSGMQGKMKYWVFKNKTKEQGSNQPDYHLCVSKLPKKPAQPAQPAQSRYSSPMQVADSQARAPYNDVPY
ncbi:hypothetical protein CMI37_18070 [Candidatus Pacearchaeota archaeon]|nr:hypothetical protein [Candidatus Pacearchaeota archaeon]|tara:strand:- start:75 stop:419 length:345 start_codon:yes stop_codon:yes gene_type:complete